MAQAPSSTNLEDAKNMALLFFMDHLMAKSGRRTIHDLSCQFGARGFTADMREAVGTTQEGLTEFLSQYPSLFALEGDEVCINAFGDLGIGGKNNPLLQSIPSRNRDYEKEAVEFFEAKLRKFGPELQIKSLLGHRSQAAPEVRLVSGRHLKDFGEFLQSQVDSFIVEGDRVRLKNMPEPTDRRVELDDEGKPLVGVKAKQAAVDFLKDVLEQNDDQPIPLDQFYLHFCDRFSHAVRQEVATNPKELLQFLKLNRAVFFIRSNKVSLVKNRPPQDGDDSGPASIDGDSNGASDKDNNNTPLMPFVNDNPLERITLIKALKAAQMAVSAITSEMSPNESGGPVVSIDFKSVTLGPQGQEFLTLVVVGTSSGKLYVFDLVHSDSIMLESGLKDLLESDQLLKVLHDGRRVGTLLTQRYGVNMRNVFDTQVAHSVLQHDKFGKPMHEMRGISFVNLQRVYFPESIMMSDLTPRKLSQSSAKNWSQRPLTDEMLLLVVEEARFLVPALYRILNNALPAHVRTLFEQKCAEGLLPNPNRPPPPAQSVPEPPKKQAPYRPPQVAAAAQAQSVVVQQQNGNSSKPTAPPPTSSSSSSSFTSNSSPSKCPNCSSCATPKKMVDSTTQTFSTGEITALSVLYDM